MQQHDSAPMLRVTVEDLETGDKQTRELPKGEYFILTAAPCYVAHTNSYPAKGTHILTIKGRTAR
jgi:hypothetical protein